MNPGVPKQSMENVANERASESESFEYVLPHMHDRVDETGLEVAFEILHVVI